MEIIVLKVGNYDIIVVNLDEQNLLIVEASKSPRSLKKDFLTRSLLVPDRMVSSHQICLIAILRLQEGVKLALCPRPLGISIWKDESILD